MKRASTSELQIRVPASIANLGPGFDTLAVAVQLYLRLSVRIGSGINELDFQFIRGQLEGENYIERAFRFLAARHEGSFPSLSVEVDSDIPAKSGLGSSAAATVAGLRLYEAIAGPLPSQELLNAACALEHHPDNVAAALLGGLTISCQLLDSSVIATRLEWPPSIALIVLTPELALSTSDARKVLPREISHEDAVFNLQRLALLIQAIHNRDYSLIPEALHDRLHQPFRQRLVPGLESALALHHPDLLGVCLSGAGPSIVALAERNFDSIETLLAETFRPTGVPFRIRRLAVHNEVSSPEARRQVRLA